MKVIPDYPERSLSGEYTFAGVTNTFFDSDDNYKSISCDWKAESTRTQYIRDYNNRLVPEIDAYKPLSEYETEDFVSVLSNIKRKYRYNDVTMSHYRYLIWKVYKAGVDRNLYQDKLLWDEYGIGNSNTKAVGSSEAEKKRLLVTRRSFSIKDEKKLLKWFEKLKPETVSGQEIGFALMFFIPTRNQEVCGLNFSDIRKITEYDIPCALIYKTTAINTNRLKAGGKTANANRIIPIFDFLFDFIEKRRNYLKGLIENGSLILPADVSDVESLPIACKNFDYAVRCCSGDISEFARGLFKMYKIGENVIKECGRTFFEAADIAESDPTAYLLRRNNCTHLACLGFDENEMQYLMGHNIEDNVKTRNYYTNDEVLLKIYRIFEMHPYNAYYKVTGEILHLDCGEKYHNNEKSAQLISLNFKNIKESKKISVVLNEKNDKLKISTGQNVSCTVSRNFICSNNNVNNTVNIRNPVAEKYK